MSQPVLQATITDQEHEHLNESSPLSSSRSSSTQSRHMDHSLHTKSNRSKKDGWVFWLLGAVILVSWNVLICTLPLFQALLPSTSSLRHTLSSYITSVFTLSNFVFLGLAQRGVGKVSQQTRLRLNLLLLLLLLTLTTFPLLPSILPRVSPALFFLLLLTLTIGLSYITSFLQSSVIAIAANKNERALLNVLSGQGGIAVLISLLQVYLAFSTLYSPPAEAPAPGPASENGFRPDGPESGPESPPRPADLVGAVGLWGVSAFFVGVCFWVSRGVWGESGLVGSGSRGRNEHDEAEGERFLDDELETERDEQDGVSGVDLIKKSGSRELLKRNKIVYLAIAWVFIVTLAVFPPITTTIISTMDPTPKYLSPSIFIPLHFLLFNVSDYLGRTYLPSRFLITSHKKLLLASLGRTLFIPLFLLCNFQAGEKAGGASKVPWVNSDWGYAGILMTFGASNGYISSIGMILASSPTLNPLIREEEKDISGSLAGFCLTAGLALGSVASFLVRWIVRGGNPFVD